MKSFVIFPFKLSSLKKSSTKLTSFGGIPLVTEMYRSLGLPRVVQDHLCLKQQGWDESSILESLIALQVAGGECMEDIEDFAEDEVKGLLGYSALPSSSSVRRFMHSFDEGVSEKRELGKAFVPEENASLYGFNELHKHLLNRLLKQLHPRWITVDVDASVVFSEKESCLGTYKGGTGYQPIQAIWAEKQIVIAEEFRDGNVPASFRALEFLKKCRSNLPKGTAFCLRSDGAWYQWKVLDYCTKHKIPFSITADLSQGLMRFVKEIPEAHWKPLYKITAHGKEETDQEYAELSFSTASLPRKEIRQRMLGYRYIVIRKKREQADLIEGNYHYQGIVSNMKWKTERQIAWHYERAGSIEQVIDKLKNDLAGKTLPCGTFGANAAWWRITCLTHNLIQALKIIALPFIYFYTRMKKLRFKLFCIAGRIVKHARQTVLQLARGDPLLITYQEARNKIAAFA